MLVLLYLATKHFFAYMYNTYSWKNFDKGWPILLHILQAKKKAKKLYALLLKQLQRQI